ncbi:hypothetical protein Rhal01_02738 [Rubritalea halochordaticola]|uniref:FecR protein domain-containing protein n=1 Tax=Rubritalea halochordaticola TaxID=714537 RepID=A0ABP9V3P9_9BACT
MKAAERKELREYADTILDGQTLSSAQMDRLDTLLRDAEARDFYLGMVEIDTHLPESIEHCDIISALGQEGQPSARLWTRRLVPAAAAVVAFGVGWLMNDSEPAQEQAQQSAQLSAPDTATARITGLIGVRWNQNPSEYLDTDSIDIESGVLELTYPNGVKVVIEGPAEYDVTGANDGQLKHGKFVAKVPDGAEGFTVSYANGKIVDLGTEFGCHLSPSGQMRLGVFEGEVELYPKGSRKVLLTKNDAVEQLSDSPEELASIPFDRDGFIREAPSREFSWHVDSAEAKEVVFDVSHLIWSEGDFSGVFKWMRGYRAVLVSNVALYRDNVLISRCDHDGRAGILGFTSDNVFAFAIPKGAYQRGNWQVRATVESYNKKPLVVDEPWVEGMFLFEDALSRRATAEDYIGRWAYTYNGVQWVRDVKAGGVIDLYINGKLHSSFEKASWTVENGALRVWIPQLKVHEDHLLRDSNTLIFTDQPYRNAHRIE